MLKHNVETLENEPLLKFFEYFVPGHSLAIMTLVLYSLPKQVYYQLKAISISE
jgi:hypothetical protein